ncbi:MAG: prolyl-tRNA synthetase associated domain-containing protein [Lachnospiraceae bacterium]|nr:prolyl-tRNA synthetase associated domain-containing protein [Lachnospiraceae bacterium]
MELMKGRPTDCATRQEREVAVYDLLDRLGIEYIRVDHEEAKTMEACEEVDCALGTAMCKNLFLCNRQKTDFYLLMMPGDKPFKTKDLSQQIGSARLSFAEAEFMEAYLNILPGSVSVMGLMNDKEHHVQLLMDKEVAESETLGCHPCVNTSSLRLSMADLKEKFLPAVAHAPIMVELPRYEEA